MYRIKQFLFTALFIYLENGNMAQNMKAVVMHTIGQPDVLKVEEVPIPKVSFNQVLVKVKAAGINPVDIHMRDGTSYRMIPLPGILGKEISGIVEEVDESVKVYKKGDRVYCGVEYGGYAEYAIANISDCYDLPDKLSFEEGAVLHIVYFVAYRALIVTGNLAKGDTLLVHGASGTIGTASVQIAKDIGAVVAVALKGPDIQDILNDTGADSVSLIETASDKYISDALEKINKTKFDVILEVLHSNLHRDKKFLARGGRILVMGKRISQNVNNLLFRPGEGYVFSVSFTKFTKEDQRAAGQFISDAIERGNIKPVIFHKYKLEEAAKAHADVFFNRIDRGKSIFVI